MLEVGADQDSDAPIISTDTLPEQLRYAATTADGLACWMPGGPRIFNLPAQQQDKAFQLCVLVYANDGTR